MQGKFQSTISLASSVHVYLFVFVPHLTLLRPYYSGIAPGELEILDGVSWIEHGSVTCKEKPYLLYYYIRSISSKFEVNYDQGYMKQNDI